MDLDGSIKQGSSRPFSAASEVPTYSMPPGMEIPPTVMVRPSWIHRPATKSLGGFGSLLSVGVGAIPVRTVTGAPAALPETLTCTGSSFVVETQGFGVAVAAIRGVLLGCGRSYSLRFWIYLVNT